MPNPLTASAIKRRLLIQTTALSSDQEAVISSLADSVLAVMEERLGRRLGSYSYTEAYDGNGHRKLYLKHDPVSAVSSVTLDGAALTVGSSAVYPPAQVTLVDEIALLLTDGTFWTPGILNVIVAYTAGWAVPPVALVDAGVAWIATLFQEGRMAGTRDKPAGSGTGMVMPKYVEFAIETYKRDALW